MLISITFILLAIVAYGVAQLQNQRKLKGQKDDISFWGEKSYLRKYKDFDSYKGERWPTSTTWTVFLTDSYHALQALMFLFLSLSFLPYGWKATLILYSLLHVVHFVVRKVFER